AESTKMPVRVQLNFNVYFAVQKQPGRSTANRKGGAPSVTRVGGYSTGNQSAVHQNEHSHLNRSEQSSSHTRRESHGNTLYDRPALDAGHGRSLLDPRPDR